MASKVQFLALLLLLLVCVTTASSTGGPSTAHRVIEGVMHGSAAIDKAMDGVAAVVPVVSHFGAFQATKGVLYVTSMATQAILPFV
jgi:hypothetical protein